MCIPEANLCALQAGLEEIKCEYDRVLEGLDGIRDTARAILSAASIIITVIGAARIVLSSTSILSEPIQIGILVLICIYFFILVVLCIGLVSPSDIRGPLKADENEIIARYMNQPEDEILKIRIVSYVLAMNENKKVINNAKNKLDWAGAFMIVNVLLLLFVL